MPPSARRSGGPCSRRTCANMMPSQARLRSDSATRVVMSLVSIPATARAHNAVTLSARTKVNRGSAVPASRSRVNATPAKSRAASAWLHRTKVIGIFVRLRREAAPAHSPTRPPTRYPGMGGRVGAWAGAEPADASAHALGPQHDADRLKDDQQIEERRVVLGVIEIVFELLARIVDRRAIGIVALRPAGDARLHHVALGIIIELLLEVLDELRALGTRADEAHLALAH